MYIYIHMCIILYIIIHMYMYVMYVYIYVYITGTLRGIGATQTGTDLEQLWSFSSRSREPLESLEVCSGSLLLCSSGLKPPIHSPQLNRQVPVESAEAWTTIFGIVAFFVVLLSDFSAFSKRQKKNGRSHQSLIAAGLVHLETQTEGLLGQGLHSSKRSSAQEGRELRAWQVGQCAIFTSTTVLECRKKREMPGHHLFFWQHFFSIDFCGQSLVASRKGWRASVPFFIIPRRCWSSGIPAMSGRRFLVPQDM